MTSNNDEMYNYLTETKNYESAILLMEKLAEVESKLRQDFWMDVNNKLKEEIDGNKSQDSASRNLGFKVDENNMSSLWFQIRNHDWNYYLITVEKMDIGIKMVDGKDSDLVCMEHFIKEVTEAQGEKFGSRFWPCWRSIKGYDFQTKDERISILPQTRELKIRACVSEIHTYLQKIIEVCNNLNIRISENKVA